MPSSCWSQQWCPSSSSDAPVPAGLNGAWLLPHGLLCKVCVKHMQAPMDGMGSEGKSMTAGARVVAFTAHRTAPLPFADIIVRLPAQPCHSQQQQQQHNQQRSQQQPLAGAQFRALTGTRRCSCTASIALVSGHSLTWLLWSSKSFIHSFHTKKSYARIDWQ